MNPKKILKSVGGVLLLFLISFAVAYVNEVLERSQRAERAEGGQKDPWADRRVLDFEVTMAQAQEAATQNGRDIALKWDAVDNSQTSKFRATMTIRRGTAVLTRVMDISRQKEVNAEKQLIAFLEPPDVRGTAYLTWAYKDPQKEDDMWVFLPAESLTRRVAGGARKGPFMRSDFSLEDILKREVDDDLWVLDRTEDLGGAACYVLTATPAKASNSSYAKKIIWVRKDIYLPTKVEFYEKNDQLIKTLILGDFQSVQGIWTPLKQETRTARQDSATTLELSQVTYNQPLAEDLFQPQNLKR
ncbi:MAG: outer membrane lipoprotein-sorting protein [Deltaproteobacteria bacterium]|jgi:outer membrane lipoprotein-sorting protein|nr:outer membrane lipoprotein-sorting protein [Deltaproteobacteria bacterium]